MRLENKVAIITGGNSGMGEAIGKLFAKEGAKVLLLARRKEEVERIRDEILSDGGICEIYAGDLKNEETAEKAVQLTLNSFKKIDILVNAAGESGSDELDHKYDTDQMHTIMETNFGGVFYMTKNVIEPMKKNGSGSIVNIITIAAIKAYPDYLSYTASKGAILAFTNGLAKRVAENQIRCNCILPGATDTPMSALPKALYPDWEEETLAEIPLKFEAKPIDQAYGALYLASDESRFVTGAQLVIDGGTTV